MLYLLSTGILNVFLWFSIGSVETYNLRTLSVHEEDYVRKASCVLIGYLCNQCNQCNQCRTKDRHFIGDFSRTILYPLFLISMFSHRIISGILSVEFLPFRASLIVD